MAPDHPPRPPAAVPVPEMEKLIALALSRGGDFADLFFEHHRSSSLLLEESIIRTASAGVTCGLGVRVVSGERTGYAYTDDLSPEAMARAARTAAHIAAGTRTVPPQAVSPAPVQRRYGPETVPVLDVAARIALLERADRAARAHDPRIEKVVATLTDETKKVRIANSAGVLTEDVQPLFSIRVSAIAQQGAVRREGMAGGGGRLGPGVFGTRPPRHFAPRAPREGAPRPPRPAGRRRGRCRWCWPRAGPASCCTRRSATAWKATSTARARPRSPGASASAWPPPESRSWTTGPSPTGAAASTSTMRGTFPAA